MGRYENTLRGLTEAVLRALAAEATAAADQQSQVVALDVEGRPGWTLDLGTGALKHEGFQHYAPITDFLGTRPTWTWW